MQNELLEKITIEKKPGSQVLITGELPFEELERHRKAAVSAISKNVKVDGFRDGHVPENILVSKVGDMAILSEMAELALSHVYPKIVAAHGLDIIGYPQIGITKLAKDNPLGFTITVAVVPEITLPDYTSIARAINTEKESKDVTDEEVLTQINDILRQKAAYERLQSKAQKNGEVEHVHGEECDHEHEHEHEHATEEAPIEDIKDLVLPEITDEYVQTLGQPGQFANAEDFKSKIREHITIDKAREVDSRHRAKITDAIIEKAVLDLPQVMIDAEINQMFAQMEEDLKRAQLNIEDYLGHIKKTKEDLVKEWTPNAEKRAKLQLVLNAIAKKENTSPDPSMVDHEVSQLLEQYKDADEKRVRVYVNSVLTNEAVLKNLESIS